MLFNAISVTSFQESTATQSLGEKSLQRGIPVSGPPRSGNCLELKMACKKFYLLAGSKKIACAHPRAKHITKSHPFPSQLTAWMRTHLPCTDEKPAASAHDLQQAEILFVYLYNQAPDPQTRPRPVKEIQHAPSTAQRTALLWALGLNCQKRVHASGP